MRRGLRRIGKAPKALLSLRTEESLKKSISAKYSDNEGNTRCLMYLIFTMLIEAIADALPQQINHLFDLIQQGRR